MERGTVYVKLHETSAFRMAIRFAGLFSLIAVLALSSVYLTTVNEFNDQIDRELVHELNELRDHYHQHGISSLTEHVKNRQSYGWHLHHYYAVSDLEFSTLSGNHFLIGALINEQVSSEKLLFIDAIELEHGDKDDDDRLRIAAQILDGQYILATAQSNNSIREMKEHTFSAVLIAVFVSVFASLAIGIYMSRRTLSNISNINQGLESSIDSNFKAHLIVPKNEDEYHELIIKLNFMLERIESLLTGMRRVTDNIAHDLRSPLTRMQSRLEVTLLQSRKEEEYRHVMEKTVEDCSVLLSTFNSLLSIAQAEAGVRGKDWREIDLTELLDELVEMYALVAEEQSFQFHWESPDKTYIVNGNRQLLAQAISNLIENSLKYTPVKGDISVSLYSVEEVVIVEVSDTGPGIDDKDKPVVIERFKRLDSARNSPGNGLGLSLVNAVAHLHNAALVLEDNCPGLRVKICFNSNQ